MRAVDGDFAFAIWDEANGALFGARDRFGVKPLWLHRSPRGLLLGSEPKQLTAYAGADLDPVAAVQYLSGHFFVDVHSAIQGIERLLPAHTLAATDATALHLDRYWELEPTDSPGLTADDVPAAFRAHITDSVERRLSGSRHCISQLSGGLDSASIAASAQVLTEATLDPTRFLTASAVYPGTDVDESHWITAIAQGQPFDHIDFEPRIGDLEAYAGDMHRTDTPTASMRRDLLVRPGETGLEHGSDLLLTGNGGDVVASDAWVLADMLRTAGTGAWWSALEASSGEVPLQRFFAATTSLRLATPRWLKSRLRPTNSRHIDTGLLTGEAVDLLISLRRKHPQATIDSGRDAIATLVTTGQSLRMLEVQEAMMATYAMEVSHPYLDRTLIEFVAGIEPQARPVTPMSKSLIRAGFAAALPESVIARRHKTSTNTMIRSVFEHQLPHMRTRFPAVSDSSARFIDAPAYRSLMDSDSQSLNFVDVESLWNAWALMLWLDHADG